MTNVDNVVFQLWDEIEQKAKFIKTVEAYLDSYSFEGTDDLYELAVFLNSEDYMYNDMAEVLFNASAELGNKEAQVRKLAPALYQAPSVDEVARVVTGLLELGEAGCRDAYQWLSAFYQRDTDFFKADEEKAKLYKQLENRIVGDLKAAA